MSDSISALAPVIGLVCGGALALLVFSVAFWTARDIAARSRERAVRIGAVALVLVLPVIGSVIYLLLRPRETIADRYEREMVEEILAREVSLAALARRQKPPAVTSSGQVGDGGVSG